MATVHHATATEIPPPPHTVARARRRDHRPLGISGGVLLLLAMFLPALRVCGDPVTPVELGFVVPPYLFGGVAAIAFGILSPQVMRSWRWMVMLFAVAVMLMYALVHLSLVEERGGPVTLLVGLWWCAAAMFWPALHTGAREWSWDRRVARAIAVPAVLNAMFFAAILVDDDTMWGTGVAFLGSALLAVGAVVWELDVAREASRLYRDPLPMAVAVR